MRCTKERKSYSKIFKALKSNEDSENLSNYTIIDGTLSYIDPSGNIRVIIPYILRERLINEFHSDPMQGAHAGSEKIIEKFKKRFYLKGMAKDIRAKLSTCENCQKRKTHANQRIPEPIFPIEPPEFPFSRIHIDICGPLIQSFDSNLYIFSTIDAFSKFLILSPLKDIKADSVVNAFICDVICKHSVPNIVVSDNGKQFVGNIFQEISKIYGFTHKLITPYNPQSNGEVERTNRTIIDMLSCCTKEKNWDRVLPLVCFAYNCAVHSSTGHSPFSILYCRDPILPIDKILKIPNIDFSKNEFSCLLKITLIR